MFMNFEDLPEEAKAAFEAQRKAMDLMNMESMARTHEINSFIMTSDLATLRILQDIIRNIMHQNKKAFAQASFFNGWLTGVMQIRYNLCPSCGKNHDEELEIACEAEESACPSCGSIDATERRLTDIDAAGEKTLGYQLCRNAFHGEIELDPEDDHG